MNRRVIIPLVALIAAGAASSWYFGVPQRLFGAPAAVGRLTLYGNVDVRETQLAFRVGGRIKTMAVDEGDAVKVGETLAVLDDGPLAAAAKGAEANVAALQAALDKAIAGPRPAEIDQLVECRADGAAGVQHVVDQQDHPVVDRERNLRAADQRLRPDGVVHQVVAVQRDVKRPDRHVLAGDLLELGGQADRDRDAARAHADERQAVDAPVALHDLVRDPGERARHPVRVHYDGHTHSLRVNTGDVRP